MTTHHAPHPIATITADPDVPAITITRDFRATPEQLLRAHTDPDLFRRWIGPSSMTTEIEHWDARDGGSWRYTSALTGADDAGRHAFRGCFHTVAPGRIVQTFTWEGRPDDVALETLLFEDLGDGHCRLNARSLCDSFVGRDQWLASGMEVGINEGYAALQDLLDHDDHGGRS
ncbi:MAG: SRPBCC domain-containing protein [Nocardioides sp.]|nr:SRPBCC domain-containing protein [Nocardioides sp.]